MVGRRKISGFVKQVAARFHPQRVILFGSYAHGEPTLDSDVDALVVMPHEGHLAEQAAAIRKSVRDGFHMDLIVCRPNHHNKE